MFTVSRDVVLTAVRSHVWRAGHNPYPVHVAVFDGSRGPSSLSGMHGELGDSDYALESVETCCGPDHTTG